jgi:hypothetical protein
MDLVVVCRLFFHHFLFLVKDFCLFLPFHAEDLTGGTSETASAALQSASSEGIARVASRALADGSSIAWFTLCVDTAYAFFTNVDTPSSCTALRRAALLVARTLRPASGDCVRLGEETRLAATDGDAQWTHLTVRVWTARVRAAWILYIRNTLQHKNTRNKNTISGFIALIHVRTQLPPKKRVTFSTIRNPYVNKIFVIKV